MAISYRAADCDLSWVSNERVAILGFGSQGRAHALNLRDSGVDVRVGLYEGSSRWQEAESEGLAVDEVSKVVPSSTVVMFCTPDVKSPAIFRESVQPYLAEGANVMFCHGYNVRYGHILAPEFCDVTMIAPSGPGTSLRELFVQGFGLPCLVAVHQDATGNAKARALSYGAAIGCARAAILESTFEEETETDLLGEQAVLVGGLMGLVRAGFETLVDAGYQPEVAYFECVHQVQLLARLMQQGGVSYMLDAISDTAAWGALEAADRVIGPESRAGMRELLAEARSGEFDAKWTAEDAAGRPEMRARVAEWRSTEMERVGADLRELMPFLPPRKPRH